MIVRGDGSRELPSPTFSGVESESHFRRGIMPKLFPLIPLLVLLAAPAGAVQQVLNDDEPCNDAIPASPSCPSGVSIQPTSLDRLCSAQVAHRAQAIRNTRVDAHAFFDYAGAPLGEMRIQKRTHPRRHGRLALYEVHVLAGVDAPVE